jgi:selT/selW/selH-like putative selenoprotein
VSLATEILVRWAPIIRTVEIRSGEKGRFEVSLDGERVFSKAESRRFPEPGEIARTFEKSLGPPLEWRES